MLRHIHHIVSTLAALSAVALLLSSESAFAAVNMSGDVPQQGTTFGTITVDNNGDNISDIIDDQGNNVFSFLADPANPGGGPGGLAWDDPQIWVDYETNQNILVGQTGPGSLEINGASALRYQHLVLGGVSETSFQGQTVFTSAGLNLQAGAGQDFDFRDQLSQNDLPTSGFGLVTVTGFGSIYNNDPNVVPGDFQTALIAAGGTAPILTTPDTSFRPVAAGGQNEGYHVFVGLVGGGQLDVDTGGQVEIQDALLVGLGENANGTVNVDGAGSLVTAYGRTAIMPGNLESTASQGLASTVGGNGLGFMNITNGGRVDLFNGLNIGFLDGAGAESGPGLGTVTVGQADGLGESVLNVYSTTASTAFPTFTDLVIPGGGQGGGPANSLSIGSRIDTPAEDRGIGELVVREGGSVNLQGTDGYDTPKPVIDANLGVGIGSRITMEGGNLNVGNVLFNGGLVTGYGDIRSTNFYNGTYDPFIANGNQVVADISASTAPGQTLTLTINGDTLDDEGNLFNRGQMSGNLSVNAVGRFENDGAVTVNGTITSGTFYNGSQGRITVGTDERLVIRATEDNFVNMVSDLDSGVTTRTGFGLNVQDDIDDDGTIDSPGDSANFYQANLGSIQVDGGEIEFGRTDSTALDPTAPFSKVDAFRNARHVDATLGVINEPPVIGSIVAQDASLAFLSGLYNTGTIAFTGGDSVVSGRVLNGGFDYDPGVPVVAFPGVITVSGDSTTVVFEDFVDNNGIISIGPHDNVVTFLGDLMPTGSLGTGAIEVFENLVGGGISESAYIVVNGTVTITGGTAQFSLSAATAPEVGSSFTLIDAGTLDPDSLFTDLILPTLPSGQYWDVIYDTVNGEVRLEIIESLAFGADFTGDGLVNSLDVDIWTANVGITSGAQIIQGDADLDGDVDLADYLVLMEQIVAGVPSIVSTGTVPEPSALLLAMMAASMCGARRRP